MPAFRRALVVALLLTPLLHVQLAQAHSAAHMACQTQQKAGDWAAFSYCLGEAMHAPGGGAKTRAVVGCETGNTFNPRIVSQSGTFVGLTQQHTGYYQGRVRYYLPNHVTAASNIKSGRWNLALGIEMAKEDGTWANDWVWCDAHT